MSIETLMRQTVMLRRPATEIRDAIGGSSVGTETTVTVLGYLEPLAGVEDLEQRGTGVGDWRLYLPADTDVTNWDRVTYAGRDFEIVAPPRPYFDPLAGVTHHWEIDLQEVQP